MNNSRLQYLVQLKEYGIRKNIPNISEQNARFLHFLIQLKKASSILEIGTANGYSTIWLADAIKNSQKPRYLGIEVSAPSYNAAIKNIQDQDLQSFVEIQFGNALEILPHLNETFDVVFIDGQKSLYLEFWKLIQPLLKPDSLVIFDDMIKFPQKTQSFLKEIQENTEYAHITVPIDDDDGIMILQKR